MEETLITWNASNMITIWLMAAIGALLFCLIASAINQNNAAAASGGS